MPLLIDDYVTVLKRLAKECEFGTLSDGLLRDRIVCGVKDNTVRELLLRETKLTLDKSLEICRASEMATKEMNKLIRENVAESISVDLVSKRSRKPYKSQASPSLNADSDNHRNYGRKCKFCGNSHKFKKVHCPAWGKTCSRCDKDNHFAICCPNFKRVSEITDGTKNHQNQDTDGEDFFIGKIDLDTNINEWTVMLEVTK